MLQTLFLILALLPSLFVAACTTIPPAPGAGGTGGDGGSGGMGGSAGSGGTGGSGGSGGLTFPCTEQGIRNAIAAGGGPHSFGCDGPTRVTTSADIFIANDVILDGGGDLIVDGDDDHRVFEVAADTTVELRGMTITNANSNTGAGVLMGAGSELTLTRCSVTDCMATDGAGILVTERALLTVSDSSISGNEASAGGGGISIRTAGTATVVGSTISGNNAVAGAGGGVFVVGGLSVTNSTLSGNLPNSIFAATGSSTTLTHSTIRSFDPASPVPLLFIDDGSLTMVSSVVNGPCSMDAVISGGDNIESPGDTCGLGGVGDNVGVTAGQLNLGTLQQNGGPTQTHEPGSGSVTIDAIDEADCEAEADQRGIERPQGTGCDVGSVEVVP